MNEEQVMNQEEEVLDANTGSGLDYTELSDEEFLKLGEPDKDEGVMMSESPVNSGSVVNGEGSSNMNQEVVDSSINSGSQDIPLDDASFRERLRGGINFNGRNIPLDNPDDILRLAQMGLNYKKKMESLNSNLGLIKSLEKNGISGDDLRFLIDLKNGDKGAIAKLLKDKEIDTYELPDLEENPYIPSAVLVDNEQATFESTLDDIRAMRGGNELLNSLGSDTWDNESLRFFRSKPEALHYLYQDKASGLYDEVLSQIELDDTLGKIPEEVKAKPFIELYEIVASQIGKQMNQNKGVNTGSVNSNFIPNQNRRVVGNNLGNGVIHRGNNVPRSANVNTGQGGYNSGSVSNVPNFYQMTDAQFEQWENSLANLNFK